MISPTLIATAAQQISLKVKIEESKKPKPGKKTIKFQNSGFGEEDFQGGYKPTASSRRSKPTAGKALNELFLEIIEVASKADEHNLFQIAVKDKDAPNYSKCIRNPMDLGSMRGKARRQEYRSHQQLREDFELIHSNSQMYNGPTNQVTQFAKEVLDCAASELNSRIQVISDVEADMARQGQ